MSCWYLVRTKPSREATAHLNICRQGYESYLPRLLRTVRCKGRLVERVGALFPRYLFVRLEEGSQSLAPVRSSVGVSDVVRFGADYAVVPAKVICDLRAREEPASGLHRMVGDQPFVRGAPVRLSSRPFGGLEGVFVCHDGAARVIILLSLLGQETRVCVPIQFVAPAGAL
jgi:transcriptional antiterminator RfaH